MVRTGQAGFLPSQHGVVDVAQDPLNQNSLKVVYQLKFLALGAIIGTIVFKLIFFHSQG